MKILKNIFIAAFLILCLVPSILMTTGYKNPNRENRPLAKLPELVKKDAVNWEYPRDFDDYVDDRFGLREHLITVFNTIEAAVLKDYNGTNAVIGKDNRIFYAETVDDHLGINLLSDEQLLSIAEYLVSVRNELSEKGVDFAFMTAPNKATIYPELMPSYLRPTGKESNIDRLTALLREMGVPVVDAKAVLLNAKNTRPVYYEHDSHWNNYGAMLVYNETARLFGLEEYDAETFTAVRDRVGDLHYFVYPTTEYYEERIVYPTFHEVTTRKPIDFDRDKEVTTTSDANGISMVFYHDSFGRSLQPIFSQSVGRLYMNSYFPYDLKAIEENEADIVLIELVERNLDKLFEYAKKQGF